MSTTEYFSGSSGEPLSVYNTGYYPLYGSSADLKVTEGGTVRGLSTTLPKYKLFNVTPSSGDFDIVVYFDRKTIVSNNTFRIRFCANSGDESSYECFGQTDGGIYYRRLSTSGTVQNDYSYTGWNTSTALDSFEIQRRGNTFNFYKDRVFVKTFTDSSGITDNGLIVFGITNTSSSNLADDKALHITQITTKASGEIAPGIISFGNIASTGINLVVTSGFGGLSGLNYKFQRSNYWSTDSWSDLGPSGISLSFNDSSVSPASGYSYRAVISDGTNTEYTSSIKDYALNTYYFSGTGINVDWIGQYIDQSTYRTGQQTPNCETWFRIYGRDLKTRYISGGTNPIYLSINDSGFNPVNNKFINTGANLTVSSGLFSSGTLDGYYDIRFRVADGYSFSLAFESGIQIISSGTPQLLKHSDIGEYYPVSGSFSDTNWDHTYLGDKYSQPSAMFGSGVSRHHNAYVDFLVDANTTKVYFNTRGDSAYSYGVYVSEGDVNNLVLQTINNATTSASGTYKVYGPITISGTGVRKVRICDSMTCHTIITDGAFVNSPVTKPTQRVVYFGDSVTSADSASDGNGASGGWDILTQILFNNFKVFNRGLSGDFAANANTQLRVIKDIAPFNPDYIIFNMGVNDLGRWNTNPTGTKEDYRTLLNSCLDNTSAYIWIVPPFNFKEPTRSLHISGIQELISEIGSPRLIYRENEFNCDATIREGDHPYNLGKAHAVGYGVGVVHMSGQPIDGSTLTVNGEVFEFDNNGSGIAGSTLVTIGASLPDTITNLANTVTSSAASGEKMLGRYIIPAKPLLQGISLRDCTSIGSSGINIATFFNSVDDGWGQVTYEMLNYNYESQSNIPIIVYYYNNL